MIKLNVSATFPLLLDSLGFFKRAYSDTVNNVSIESLSDNPLVAAIASLTQPLADYRFRPMLYFASRFHSFFSL